jgi:hypothetical protein
MDQKTTGADAVAVGARRGFHDVYDAHDEDKDMHKRRRLTYHGDDNALKSSSALSPSTVSSTSFLGFHLELLKTLYVENPEKDNDNDILSGNCAIAGTLSSQQQQAETKDKWDDGPIDSSIWKMRNPF